MEYPFTAITLRSILTQSSSTLGFLPMGQIESQLETIYMRRIELFALDNNTWNHLYVANRIISVR